MKLLTCMALLVATVSYCSNEMPGIAEVLTKRYSGYSYDNESIVTPDQLESIIKAAQLAPSSYNDQPWYFIICDRTTNPEAYDKVFNTLVEFNQEWAKNAPVLIVSVASKNSHQGDYNRWAEYDTGAAALSMMLQATHLGLIAHQMGGFDPDKIKEAFNISDDFVPMSIMAIGYAKHGETKTVKQRKPLTDNFFMGSWEFAESR